MTKAGCALCEARAAVLALEWPRNLAFGSGYGASAPVRFRTSQRDLSLVLLLASCRAISQLSYHGLWMCERDDSFVTRRSWGTIGCEVYDGGRVPGNDERQMPFSLVRIRDCGRVPVRD